MKAAGKKNWYIADGYIPSKSTGTVSHESFCVLNTGDADASITITLYFEDKEPMTFTSFCGAKRTHHIRFDRLKDAEGREIQRDVPYAVHLESSVPVVGQHTRLDTSSGAMALMTAVAFSE